MRSSTKKMMDYCTYCPKMCRFSCPVSEADKIETHTPWGKMEIGRWVIDKTLTLSEELAQAAYQCTNCLHCQQYCEHLNDVPAALGEIRRLAVENYAAPPEAYALEKRFAESNNPYGGDLLEKSLGKLSKRVLREGAEVALFPCCHTLHFFPNRLARYFELFEKLGVGQIEVVQGGVPCCGEPLRALGFQEDFEEIAEVQYHALKKYKLIVTDGPECCNSLKRYYPELGLPLEERTIHLLEFLSPLLSHHNYRTRGDFKGKIAYHDSPYMSRYLGLIELPRKILKDLTGFNPVELGMWGAESLSAGTEGSYALIFPEISDRIARRPTDEVASRGIGRLITACSKAEAIFKKFANGFAVQDIFEFLNENIL